MVDAGFVALPDTPATGPVRATVPWESPRVVAHSSGRPWLVGTWSQEQALVVAADPVRVAVIGFCPVTADRLSSLVARIRTVSDVDTLASILPGSHHVIASVGGQVRAQGSVSGLRRVFHTRLHGLPLSADRAETLATMTNATVDEQALAVRVACGAQVPPPLGEESIWAGIYAVPTDHYLSYDCGDVRQLRWWYPPAPVRSLRDGASAVHEALTTTMRHRAPTRGQLSTDLSGGMDSTSLCFLAADANPELLTMRWGEAEAGNDDAVFASHAIEVLDKAEHLVPAQHELPALFDASERAGNGEEPWQLMRAAERLRVTARLLSSHGARRHLAGHGGDELFIAPSVYLRRLLWRHPLSAIQHLRAYRAQHRWPLWSTVRQLLRPSDVSSWWRQQAENLTAAPPARGQPTLEWGLGPLRAPSWVTSECLDLVRQALRRTADEAAPLATDPAQHQILLRLRTNAVHYRLIASLFADFGVELDMPYYDDRLVEAVLSVRPHEYAGPWRYKPLLVEALRDFLPEALLGRSSKGEFSEDLRQGLRRNLPAIQSLFSNSALAAHGLIDPEVLRGQLAAPYRDFSTAFAWENLIGCETWLRAALENTTTTGRPDASATAS